jgi:hypothetical protein
LKTFVAREKVFSQTDEKLEEYEYETFNTASELRMINEYDGDRIHQ